MKYLVLDESSQNKMRLVSSYRVPSNYITRWPRDTDDFFYDCMTFKDGVLSIDKDLLEKKVAALFKEGKSVPQIYPTRPCFILDSEVLYIKDIPFSSVPEGFLKEAPFSFTKEDEKYVSYKDGEIHIDWDQRFKDAQDVSKEALKKEIESGKVQAWNNMSPLGRMISSIKGE